jgi:RNA-directed DNA polymerase
MKSKKWYKSKNYPHFDTALSYDAAEKYVSDVSKIEKHSFLPFISKTIKFRQMNRDTKKDRQKERPIKYASHVDGYIFSYYAYILSLHYENFLKHNGIDSVVLAYRSGIGNNIVFAKAAFDHIERFGNCIAYGFDISGFFDSLDHTHLKKMWKLILNVDVLPKDHFAVFRAITKYAYVDLAKCYERLGFTEAEIKRKIRQQTSNRRTHNTSRLQRMVCSIEDFRNKIKGKNRQYPTLINQNNLGVGIPQGSPISALLANVYMIPFDIQMQKFAMELGCIYRRYSDDILVICPPKLEDKIQKLVIRELAKLGNQLLINENKTLISHFQQDENNTISLKSKKPFQYLGFTYDGQRRIMRSQTLSRYWRKMKSAARQLKKKATIARKNGRNDKFFLRKFYRKYTHLGKTNFISYAKRSAKLMAKSDNWKSEPIWKQVRRNWKKANDHFQSINIEITQKPL